MSSRWIYNYQIKGAFLLSIVLAGIVFGCFTSLAHNCGGSGGAGYDQSVYYANPPVFVATPPPPPQVVYVPVPTYYPSAPSPAPRAARVRPAAAARHGGQVTGTAAVPAAEGDPMNRNPYAVSPAPALPIQ